MNYNPSIENINLVLRDLIAAMFKYMSLTLSRCRVSSRSSSSSTTPSRTASTSSTPSTSTTRAPRSNWRSSRPRSPPSSATCCRLVRARVWELSYELFYFSTLLSRVSNKKGNSEEAKNIRRRAGRFIMSTRGPRFKCCCVFKHLSFIREEESFCCFTRFLSRTARREHKKQSCHF